MSEDWGNESWLLWQQDSRVQAALVRVEQSCERIEQLTYLESLEGARLPRADNHADIETMRECLCRAAELADILGERIGTLTYHCGIVDDDVAFLRKSWLIYVAGANPKVPNTRIEASFDEQVAELTGAHRKGKRYLEALKERMKYMRETTSLYETLLRN